MIRPHILFASRDRTCAESLSSYYKAVAPGYSASHASRTIVFDNVAELFEELNSLEPAVMAETMVVFDACADRHNLWDAAGVGLGDRGIGVQLVLQYPEIYFVFVGGDDSSFPPEVKHYHVVDLLDLSKLLQLIKLHAKGFRVLYDASGLRSILKQSLMSADGITDNRYQSAWETRRETTACVIEDEITYAQFNAYAAYRAGCQVFTVTSHIELERLLPVSERVDVSPDPHFHTIVTDWDIRLADFVPDDHAAGVELEKRLRRSEARIFVVTSQKNAAIEGFLTSTPELSVKGIVEGELSRARAADVRCVEKPYPGLFELVELLQARPLYNTPSPSASKPERHTATYAPGLIADNLLLRAKRLFDVDERDQGLLLQLAVVSGEAKEILGGLSPTTFLEALSLQNAAEVRAEASYLGMLSEISPASRIRAFEAEAANSVLTSAREEEQTKTMLNYTIQQLTSFRQIYNEYEAVVAAEICLQGIAKRQRLQLLRDRQWSSRLKFVGIWYSDLVTKSSTSVGRLIAADLVIIGIFFSVFYAFLLFHHCGVTRHFLWLSLGHSVLSFMEMAPGLGEYEEAVKCAIREGAAGWMLVYRIALFLEITLAYVNLGLLIAMLYRRVTRRVP